MAPPFSTGLVKALIINTTTRDEFPVMYNPEEFKLEQGNTFAEVGIPGLDKPPVQYVRGKARTLTMELFFDTYEAKAKNEKGELVHVDVDVRVYTEPIVRLLHKLPQTQAPPILLFSMGLFQFECVLVDAGQRFTMFLPSGTPVRSIMSVRFQEYVRADIEIQGGLFFGSPTVSAVVNTAVQTTAQLLSGSSTVHITLQGDTLSSLAAAYLGDAALWRDIAQANNIDDPFNLLVGLPLVIPTRGLSQVVGLARG